ncbi:type ISP restriction/modification enzyme, partial [Collinsella sp. Sow4_D11]|uniref:type ISP restriction/modification enzyme n=1 Tax=Collinsella sp. Sow4_D11 TaxID=3438775 RepID=UPI003F8DB81D
ITNSYVRLTDARRVVSVYDSYLKAFRWATDRLASNGVIGFITNSSFVDFKTMNGVRRSFENEFNYVYVLNLRGAIKERLGELAKKEGQNVFDIMTGVAITILIKDGSQNHDIYYYDIGDYLTRKDKFDYLEKTYSMINVDWLIISPDENGDWINKRDKNYLNYVPMGNDSSTNYTDTMFKDSAIGVTTSRDSWVYNFGKKHVFDNSAKLVRNYNNERERLSNYLPKQKLDYINTDSTYMSWSRKTKTKLSSNISINHDERKIVKSSYRPYTYKWLYYDTDIVEMPGRFKDFLGENNKVIYVSGPGVKRDFSVIMTSAIPCLLYTSP